MLLRMDLAVLRSFEQSRAVSCAPSPGATDPTSEHQQKQQTPAHPPGWTVLRIEFGFAKLRSDWLGVNSDFTWGEA
eukprot:7988316-Alexandrium_andersonii.AAC.1